MADIRAPDDTSEYPRLLSIALADTDLVFVHDVSTGRISTLLKSEFVEAMAVSKAISVESLAQLKALGIPTSSRKVVNSYRSAAGDGGGGVWAWRSGDQSANITADTQSGLWAAPDTASTGASGAWQRQFSGYLDDRWFGVKGDGTTNDTTALQAALSSCPTGGVVLHPGRSVVGNLTIPANVTLLGGIKGLDSTSDNLAFDFTSINSALYTTAGTTITLNKGAAIQGCLLSPSVIAGALQSTTSSFAGTALTAAGQGVCVSNNIILGYTTAFYSSSFSRQRVEWNAIDAQAAIAVGGTYDSTRIVNNHCWPYLTHTAFWNSGANYGARDKTKLYRTGVGLSLFDGSDDTQVDGNMFYGFSVGIQAETVNGVNFGRNWIDHPYGVARSNNYGIWFKTNVADIQAQTFFVYGTNTGVVFDMNSGEQVVIDLLHTELIDGTGVVQNSGDVHIGRHEAQSCGGYAYSVGSTTSHVVVEDYYYTAITGAQPVSLAAASCTSDKVRFGDYRGHWDGAAGGYFFGTNALTHPTIASADPLNLPANGNTFFVSGTTGFGTLAGGWGGRRVRLIFLGALTVFDGAVINMSGNFVTTANDVLNLIHDGTQWLEDSRSIN